jgi:polyhydroxyalkanoate synthesis regulator protein
MESWGADPFKAMQETAARNMTMFNDAMKVFNPFAAVVGGPVAGGQQSAAGPGSARPQSAPAGKDDLQQLKDQLAAMQQRLDTIAGK